MADFYHDSLMHNLSHHIYQQQQQDPSIIDPTTTATAAIMLNDERECFNVTELEAVPNRLGQWFLISLYSLTSLLALIGNLTVIIVELYGKESAHNIRKYLINLAVSDITIGVLCVPFTYTDFMLGQWIFPHWLCPTAQFVQLLSVFVTSLTLTFIGIERYVLFDYILLFLKCQLFGN
uniref:Neuropeptide Y receptor type 5-like n=1 Tax=Dermatophagoides pteronyssinus TaxID=6956 RepID=A0A6P6XRB8_DERPT|nr:neuropeptide Y receptor type 5-like [Dermatophagoides pteronyssinus]